MFLRVQTDYRARLQQVAERLASHRQAIEEERTNFVSRRSMVEAEERSRRDERAELDLRAHVGELDDQNAGSAFASVDGAIQQLVDEKDSLTKRITELEDLLIDRPVPGVGPASTASPRGSDERSAEPSPEGRASGRRDAALSENASKEEGAASESGSEALRRSETPAWGISSMSRNASVATSAPEPAAEPATGGYARRAMTPSGTFDDLAFLNSLVEPEKQQAPDASPAEPASPRPTPRGSSEARVADQPVDTRSGETAAAPAAEGTPRRTAEYVRPPTTAAFSTPTPTPGAGAAPAPSVDPTMPEEPLAMNVTGARPIVLRTTMTTEMSKSLKCNECGSMNYPTEWYCERCGAELAAL